MIVKWGQGIQQARAKNKAKMAELPLNYIIDKIYKFAPRIKYNASKHTYNFSCPICGEGKSKNKKRRGFFFENEKYFYCQNCQKSWSPINWILELEHISFKELLTEASEHDNTFNEIINRHTEIPGKKNQHSLPYDSINLSDPVQLQYYKDKKEVQDCLRYIKERRLNTAINRPKTFFISLSDRIHRNRLIIPFYDMFGKIVYYQSRALYAKDEEIAKYFSKKDANKTLYGIQNVSTSLDHIFIHEGPIDSMFCRNAVAACGLDLTDVQKEQLDKYRLYDKIWVLDNQLENQEVKEKYEELIDRGESIFFWPIDFKNYKDMNDVCVATGKDHIPPKFIISNALKGMQAKLKLAEMVKLVTAT